MQDGGRRQVPPRQLHPQPRALHRRRAAGAARRRHRAQSVGSLARRARLVPRGRPARQRGSSRLDRQQARTRARGRPQHHGGVGHRRRQREAGRLHRRAGQGRHGMRGRSEERDRCAGRPRQEVVAGRQHLYAARSISRSAPELVGKSRASGGCHGFIGGIAAGSTKTSHRHRSPIRSRPSRARTSHPWRPPSTPARSIRKSCCAASATSAPGAAIRPGMARPICAAPFNRSRHSARSAAPPPSWRGARTRWSGTPRIPTIRSLSAKFGDRFASGQILGGTGLSNPMKSFFGIEKLKLKGTQGRRRLCRARRAALGLEPRPRPFLRHHLRARGRAGRHRDVPGRLLGSRDHLAAVQAVPRDGRHRHLWRAIPRSSSCRTISSWPNRPGRS